MKFSRYFFILLMLGANLAIGQPESNQNNDSVLSNKIVHEKTQDFNPFSLLAYEQNYMLPLNYTASPPTIYNGYTPDDQKIKHLDFKFQFSFKTPVVRDLLRQENVIYLAYTQQSYWQSYNKSAFFRANNYQPEVFIENNISLPLSYGWTLQLLNVGLAHQSNGRGGILERTWNRAYAEASFAKERWLISIRGWVVIRENSFKKHNPDMKKYLGHGRILIAHNFDSQVLSLLTYNNIESRFKRGSFQLSYSFPIGKKIKGYAQFFNGFGQNLIEYNHRTSAYGVGISFSDWL